jgi:anti-sigma regulatory factor (Ser/Thr protein kinase)
VETISTTPDLSASVESERSRIRIPSRPEWIPSTVEFLKQRAQLCGACRESRAGKLVLALHEALTNAVVHGNLEVSSGLKERDDDAFARILAERAADPIYSARQVLIEIDHNGERCRWSFTDEGRGFDYRRYLDREPDPEAMFLASGRGILLMKAFVDEVEYEHGGRKVTLTLYQASGAEKRREARHTLNQRIQVAPVRGDGSVDWQAAHDAIARDFSATGMGLLQARLATSERVLLGVEVEGETYYLPAQVRRCETVGDGVVEIGCRFLLRSDTTHGIGDGPSVEDAIESLLQARRIPQDTADRRTSPREPYTECIEIVGVTPLVGFARDLSRTGISFITTTPIPLGPRLLSLPQADGDSLRVKAQIVR